MRHDLLVAKINRERGWLEGFEKFLSWLRSRPKLVAKNFCVISAK